LPYGLRRKRQEPHLEASEAEAEAEARPLSAFTPQLWHKTEQRCPNGSIPIRRTKEEDLLRASKISRFGKKHHKPVQPQFPLSAGIRSSLNVNGHQVWKLSLKP
jgi:hypothetical protein